MKRIFNCIEETEGDIQKISDKIGLSISSIYRYIPNEPILQSKFFIAEIENLQRMVFDNRKTIFENDMRRYFNNLEMRELLRVLK